MATLPLVFALVVALSGSSTSAAQRLLAERVRDTVTRFDALVDKDLAAFNDLLKRRNIQHVVAK